MSNIQNKLDRRAPRDPLVLVCRIAWMDRYQGVARGDTAVGGGAFVEEHGWGHEIFNFLRDPDGRYRGYVRPPGRRRASVEEQHIRIQRLGAGRGEDRVAGVLVFWAATHPIKGGTYVVGWYDNATVHRAWQPSPQRRALPDNHEAGFMVEAGAATRLSPDDRLFQIPRANSAQTGMGQSNVWYPRNEDLEKLLIYRRAWTPGRPLPPGHQGPPPGPGMMQNTEERLRIERVAMEATTAWCDRRGLRWEDVSQQHRGWDLEAGEGKALLRIEVKGTSRSIDTAVVELTPNEFAKMTEYRSSFRLSVVSVSETTSTLVMFAWSDEVGESGAWVGEGGYELRVSEVIGARAAVEPRS